MCDFTESERQRLAEARSLAWDEEGREVLVGLTAQETDSFAVPALFRLWNPLIFRDGFESGLLNSWAP